MTEPLVKTKADEVESLNIEELDVNELERRVAATVGLRAAAEPDGDCTQYACYKVYQSP